MKREISIALVALALVPSQAVAAECEVKACIQVYTQDGHIVIEGRKGSGPKASTSPVPAPITTPKPKVTKKVVVPPKPKVKSTRKPSVIVQSKKPTVKKTQSPATSLEDKLIESIPTAGISYQPSFSPLIQTPVYFWSDIPTLVTKKIEIVGEVVTVRLHPTFIWHYGDGVFFLTHKVGAPFPEGEIRHTYSKAGTYLIELVTRWDGEFEIDGVSQQIPGRITTVSVLPITVVAAPIRFMN
ncbi:unannotated protein [freshwater metagenome]|uniref:Unannotated protein n=1 Tax=freshwater metagenome TaxID=449393 RepID=A0A6J7F226_9ZZZZ|nr:hypothetical protein [Actinomycetota bacterium]